MDPDASTWEHKTTVGTGGGGMVWRVPTVGMQRMVLAQHFASYGLRHYQSCYLSIHEYHCLKQLLQYLKDEYNGAFGDWKKQQNHIQSVALLEDVCDVFRTEYAKDVPAFIFELLKEDYKT